SVEAVDALVAAGEKVGVVGVHLYRPFDAARFTAALPETVTAVAVLDRTKEPGSTGEPLFLDVVAALAERRPQLAGRVVGGRYGLSSKEFTPPMAMSVFDELARPEPRRRFTVGIVDDVTHLSLDWDDERWNEPDDVVRAVFYGLGSDGTVGANKNSVKIIGDLTPHSAQGYFVYDSKKSGSMTVSHLRFGPRPITSTHLIRQASFVACHHAGLLDRVDVLGVAAPGATVLLNLPHPPADAWRHLPVEVQQQILDKRLDVWVVDASRVASDAGLGSRVNTVLQTCFFYLSGVLEPDAAVAAIKDAIAKSYSKRGQVVLQRNFAAVDAAVAALHRMPIPAGADEGAASGHHRPAAVPPEAPEFVQRVTAAMIEGRGDLLPVSALPVDGTFPTGTARWEKRSIAAEIPIWDPDICIDCARCALVCPHAAIRMKVYDPAALAGSPELFRSRPWPVKGGDDLAMTIQVAPDDCTGCGVCVNICPAKSKEMVKHKAIDMLPKAPHLDIERSNFAFFADLPAADRTTLDLASIKGSQQAEPLFEFSGACSGCGETPYLKLLTQILGDRIVVANATGCSSIYGGNLPTTPWSVGPDGRGPAWANSLFEDNAEFGLGMRLAVDHLTNEARSLVAAHAPELGSLAADLLDADQSTDAGIAAQRERVERLRDLVGPHHRLAQLAEHLVRTSVWIVGGDGWAYDIGFGGLDHVLASGRDVNVLVLDTEVYSNTGGQTSKATPRAAIAKFSAGGKATAKKDLGMIAMAYGDVYVAQVAMGANMTQVVKAFAEAEAHRGPSLIIAYSPCIAHGIDMTEMMQHQKAAAESGYWPLYRYDPGREARGEHALHLDSRAPKQTFREFALTEARFAMLARANPEVADQLMEAAQHDIDNRWHLYEQMVNVERTATFGDLEEEDGQ
ncbi:MAG: pyruvate:ferredoxin (flavodoxin) oxidoreductase, partial [Acidimicrobiales bacterium]|nr:pyruvate:ferredoxin (flavodoxin) oxidoreductase [Acidimicrobiales bacterium]